MNETIKKVSVFKAKSKISQPIADSTHDISEIAFYVCRIQLENGVTGEGYLLSFHYSPNAIEGAFKDISKFAVGYKAYETAKFKRDYDMESEYFGQEGIQRCAAACINVAMWDAWCKTLGQPVWKVLGSCCERVPVYGSGGWISYSDEELIDEVVNYKKRGFKAVKIKVGSKEEGRDIRRLSKVREVVGNDINIMMDANQGMDVMSAIKLANEAQPLNIHWFEEPIPHDDFKGYSAVYNKTRVSIAMGEREYNLQALRSLIELKSIDLWQPDIIRIGGVEAWKQSASLAAAYNIPVLPHYYKDYDVALLCTVQNGYGIESFDWIDAIIDNTMRIEEGYAYPRQTPGWGFSFKDSCLEEIKL